MITTSVTITGQVHDPDGNPVADAMINSQSWQFSYTDENGDFSLPGVASTGRTRIWANHNNVYGAIVVNTPNPEANHIITLGKGLSQEEGDYATINETNITSTPLSIQTLDGQSLQWSAPPDTSAQDHILVFSPLWHPMANQLIDQAAALADEKGTTLDIISLDWNLAQAQRESAKLSERLPGTARVFYGGPDQLQLSHAWQQLRYPGIVMIASDGTIRPLAAPSK